MSQVLMIREGQLPRADNGGLFISPGHGRHPCRQLDSFEIIMVRSGRLKMGEEDKTFSLDSSDMLILFPGYEHRGLSDYETDTSFYWVHFYLPKRVYRIRSEGESCRGFFAVPQCAHPARPERMIELFRQFLHGQEERFRSPFEADLLVAQMLVELAFHVKRTVESPAAERLAERVKAVVDAEFHQSVMSPGFVAQRLDVNGDYLGRVFRMAFGQTIGDYIHHRRLREARKLLQESELNVNQVAMAVGFTDPGYFRRLFRRHYEIRPGDLRRLYYRTHVNIR